MKGRHVTELLQRSTAAKRSWPALSMLTAAVLASFSMASSAADLENPIASGAKPADRIDRGGVIYAMTNAADGNEILVFGPSANFAGTAF